MMETGLILFFGVVLGVVLFCVYQSIDGDL